MHNQRQTTLIVAIVIALAAVAVVSARMHGII